MFVISESILTENFLAEHFACDLGACKGACCTLPGGRGAPLEDEEVGEIRRAYHAAARYLSDAHKAVIERAGMIEGEPGNFATSCVDDRACVFVYYDGGIARCSLERAYMEGATG